MVRVTAWSVLVLVLASCGDDDDDTVEADGDADADADGDSDLGDPLVPVDPCDDVVEAMYQTPDPLPPFAESGRGEILGCVAVETIDAADVAARMADLPDVVVVGGDVRVYLVAYVTERADDIGGVATALVYLPDVAMSERVPLVVATHGSVGLGDSCATSHLVYDASSFLTARYFDGLFLAWAARGLPVVAPDYAGLGTDGVHGYDLWADPARSAIDGARVLRDLLPAERLDGGTIVSGHSQGGGIALTVADEIADAPDLSLAAVVAIAPGYRLTRSVDILRFTAFALLPEIRLVIANTLYASLANLEEDPARWGDALHPDVRDYVSAAVAELCWDEAIARLDAPADGYVPPATLGELVDPTFREAVVSCPDGEECVGTAAAWYARDDGNEPHIAAPAPPILVIASTDDESATPGAVGCALDRIAADGVTPEVCIWTGEDHRSLVPASAGWAIEWAVSTAAGDTPPECPSEESRSDCSLL